MNETTLLQACWILFGDEVVITEHFLAYLQHSGLKKAYRRRVLATHPDRLPTPTHQDIADFHAVQRAFHILSVYLQKRESSFAAMGNAPRNATPTATDTLHHPLAFNGIKPFLLHPSPLLASRQTASIDDLYQGIMPKRPLLFGHFLYYSGLTSWRTITAVLVEQKKNRPRLGELSTHYGLLDRAAVYRVLTAIKLRRAAFGATAVALGLLNEQQVQHLLEYQKKHQKKFGTILVDKELITPQELTALLAVFRRHNRHYNP